ncbi:MAG TPA: M23 family metallopeptidase [Thermoanaerobaculia bacterium]|nr:M23 family metallopeptidase [Thermoanaerobaculia bacterium]
MKRAAAVAAIVIVAAIAFALFEAGPAFRHPIAALRLVRADAPAHLPVPVAGLKPRDVRDSWGAPRSGGRHHQGIDIFAPRGRAILSTTPGIVLTVGTNRLGGRVVRVLGPGGQWHYYAHLETYGNVHPGDLIPAGTVVGTVGDSGNARGTPPHLHYGIYRFRGGAMNPYPLLK